MGVPGSGGGPDHGNRSGVTVLPDVMDEASDGDRAMVQM